MGKDEHSINFTIRNEMVILAQGYSQTGSWLALRGGLLELADDANRVEGAVVVTALREVVA